MISAVVVVGTLTLAVLFSAAWALRPEWRAWIEAPKHRFQADLRRYDQQRHRPSSPERGPNR